MHGLAAWMAFKGVTPCPAVRLPAERVLAHVRPLPPRGRAADRGGSGRPPPRVHQGRADHPRARHTRVQAVAAGARTHRHCGGWAGRAWRRAVAIASGDCNFAMRREFERERDR